MSLTLPDCPKFAVSRTGLIVHEELSFDEWAALAPALGEASRGVAFLIGDWLLYGGRHFGKDDSKPQGRVQSNRYKHAIASTGLDRTTLQAYAYVARHVTAARRHEALSWEHHKAVAKLQPRDQQHWLSLTVQQQEKGTPISTRRLRRSLEVGRLLSVQELTPDPTDRGLANPIPHINRLCAWWTQTKQSGWLKRASAQQRAALKRDLRRVLRIYEEL